MSLFRKLVTMFTGTPDLLGRPVSSVTERDLIKLESEVGRELFGPVPDGHRRDFFCLDNATWVWQEEWQDPDSGQLRQLITRYEVQPNGILKVQTGHDYSYVDGVELQNLAVAIRLYYERTMRRVYQLDPYTGQSLA
ncbi:MAG: hypothetical protein ACM3MA_02150 [Acidobacteriota bacterium]